MKRSRRINRHEWVLEPLLDFEACRTRAMFGGLACYFNELLVVVLADGEEPWNGVLVPTERENHAAIMQEFPALSPHPILAKWLFLPDTADSFEPDAEAIVERIRRLDPRFGIIPPAKKRRATRKKGH